MIDDHFCLSRKENKYKSNKVASLNIYEWPSNI